MARLQVDHSPGSLGRRLFLRLGQMQRDAADDVIRSRVHGGRRARQRCRWIRAVSVALVITKATLMLLLLLS